LGKIVVNMGDEGVFEMLLEVIELGVGLLVVVRVAVVVLGVSVVLIDCLSVVFVVVVFSSVEESKLLLGEGDVDVFELWVVDVVVGELRYCCCEGDLLVILMWMVLILLVSFIWVMCF